MDMDYQPLFNLYSKIKGLKKYDLALKEDIFQDHFFCGTYGKIYQDKELDFLVLNVFVIVKDYEKEEYRVFDFFTNTLNFTHYRSVEEVSFLQDCLEQLEEDYNALFGNTITKANIAKYVC